MSARVKTAILISGRGSNMQALVAAAAERDYPAEIVGVVSDRPEAGGLAVAAAHGIATAALPRGDFPSRDAHEAAIDLVLRDWGAEIVCLAGYMRMLSAGFVERRLGRVINIHPSLLPLFKGLDTHSRALEAGVSLHGCTVHFVTAGMDEGPIIGQAAVPVSPSDTPDTLASRVLHAEHQLYGRVLRWVAEGRVTLENGRAVHTGFTADDSAALIAPTPGIDPAHLENLARFTP
ncbi:MAG: phosphoribosylglycinamide formyltransferase [Rhizobiaceae bacterium]|nr:phosphoribosylglycinamide formyltransferase [Rhizobiaceae bacterium]